MSRRWFPQMAAGIVLAVSLLVFVGYFFDIPFLRTIRPNWGVMKFNTATGLLLLSLSLWGIQAGPSSFLKKGAPFLSGVVLLIGFLTLIEHLFQLDLGVDQLLFRAHLSDANPFHPGRMTPAASSIFFLLGLSFLLDLYGKTKSSQFFNLLALVIPAFAIIGYFYDFKTLMIFWPYASMAAHTALSLSLISLGLICVRWEIASRLIRSIGLFIVLAILLLVGGVAYYGEVIKSSPLAHLVLMIGIGLSTFFLILIFILLRREIARRKDAMEEIERLNQDLKHHGDQLESANRELEAFSYSVSHDLRAPLRVIDGFSQAVLEDYGGQLDEQGKHFLERIRAGSQTMGQLIDDLLSLSRLTRSELKREKVDLSALAESLVEDLRKGEPGRLVEVVVTPGLSVMADPHLLRVVLVNLLGNAWKFTSKTSQAKIELGCRVISSAEGGKSEKDLAYFVRDNGAGFDMIYANKLFGAFQRLHSASEFGGTGIGLATVHRIIHRHGGRIWAEGEVGRGATFYFTLG